MVQRVKNVYHLFQAFVACMRYGFPGRKLTVIGITGTDGKTTTASLIYSILKKAGKKVSLITSVNAVIGDKIYDTGFHVTTPSPFFLQKMLKQALTDGSMYFILEVTSHAIDQNRIWGIPFALGVLTNVTHEHLDYHHTYNEYLTTKASFLSKCQKCLINHDDLSYKPVRDHIKTHNPNTQILSYGYTGDYTFKRCLFSSSLPGEYNKSNCLASFGAGVLLNIPPKSIQNALMDFPGVSGRFEIIAYKGKPKVIIDFAHTPNSLKQILTTISKQYTAGKIIHVFGCAGLRDSSKRSEMGYISASLSDMTVVTEEDFRTENLTDINKNIIFGIRHFETTNKKKHQYVEIENRSKAIAYAIGNAVVNDTLVLTGKGHEKSLCRKTKEYPWNEREEVLKALRSYKKQVTRNKL